MDRCDWKMSGIVAKRKCRLAAVENFLIVEMQNEPTASDRLLERKLIQYR
jgi:hypothetical protein